MSTVFRGLISGISISGISIFVVVVVCIGVSGEVVEKRVGIKVGLE